ncbi:MULTISPECIES: NUDIX domain-containing protein [Catenuloplanes]|uniref:8-oxo-dGTP pyrophosphatase MutT (NUDIX family) n=1 Tax=Catenuloplanes niger TaxID=587534 RepID=A0AAE3ZWH6_9ACTN|nr:NUDIX domain-containing protein [Catenuloplanes niger]MDR7326222.1 8-oxo-dGTP pyrophosphatase MutT (NUDIX family) [Catenuloplanes niger]
MHAHCSFCGAAFAPDAPWPRRCTACGKVSYRNPAPVAVALQPVGDGLLVVRRGIPPAYGRPALPGGYIDVDESWQAAVVRELREETGVVADAATVTLFDVHSAPDGTVLIFGLLPPIATPPPEFANDESLGHHVLDGPAELGFPLHTRVADRFFADTRPAG